MRFCGYVPNSLRNKNLGSVHPYLLSKMFFLAPKDCYIPWSKGKKTFFLALNVMILKMVRNESLRFGRHVDVQVSYKIL